MDLILKLLEVSFWSAFATVGFGILFNVPKKAIIAMILAGFGAGFIKFLLIHFQIHIIVSSFFAAFFVGLVSIPLAHKIHLTPVVFSIPAIIPMIPGYYAYETVLSIMNFIFTDSELGKKSGYIEAIFTNGFNMFYILISLTVGVSLPMLLLKTNSVKNI